MTNLKNLLTLLAILITIWAIAYLHERNHRYDVAVAGAGSSGDSGLTIIRAYVIDHETGNISVIQGSESMPVQRKGW